MVKFHFPLWSLEHVFAWQVIMSVEPGWTCWNGLADMTCLKGRDRCGRRDMTGPWFSGLGEPKPRVSRGYDGNITYNYAILHIYIYIYIIYVQKKGSMDWFCWEHLQQGCFFLHIERFSVEFCRFEKSRDGEFNPQDRGLHMAIA